jgi:cellulose synthase/poly-beta-1,6-N-acetylglucosamine synthase-like glycosyltransferase
MDIRPQAAPGAIERLVSNFADPTVGCVAGELILRDEGHDAACKAVGGLYWRYEQLIRKCESSFDSPGGVYGGFYAIRRALFVEQPAGIILDDMFEPLSIIRQGYRSVLDSEACVYDTWPKKVKGEFHRKVRTLAGNFQLFRLAPWTLGFSNRVWFQLISHKVLRLVVPYLLISLLVSEAELATQSWLYAAFATAGVLGLIASLIGLSFEIPGFQRFVAPASALLALNAAAVVGLYKFLFVRGPLWKIWNSGKPVAATPSFRSDSITPTEHEVVATAAVKRT